VKKTVFLAFLVFILTFTSCDDFFSSSWGTSREYDPSNINVNAGNVDQWIKTAVGNPALAEAITEKIIQELENVSGPDKVVLMQAGIKLAVESSGLGILILINAADLLGNFDKNDTEALTDILDKIQEGFNSGGGPNAANNLATIACSGIIIDNDGVPVFEPEFANSVSPGDVAEAIMVLVLGELSSGSIEDWSELDSYGLSKDGTDENPKITVDPDATPGQIALAAYLNLIADSDNSAFNDNPLTQTIREAFFGF